MNTLITLQEVESLYGDEIEAWIAKFIGDEKAAFVLRTVLFHDIANKYPVVGKPENCRAALYVSARTRAINYINFNNALKNANAEQTLERPEDSI
jgi:predicted RNA polymerase sigma factor